MLLWLLQVPLTKDQQEAQEAKPDRLALGGGGGFQVGAPKQRIEEERSIVVLPEMLRLALPNAALPEQVSAAIAGILVRLRFFTLSLRHCLGCGLKEEGLQFFAEASLCAICPPEGLLVSSFPIISDLLEARENIWKPPELACP